MSPPDEHQLLFGSRVTESPPGGALDSLCRTVSEAFRVPAAVGLVLTGAARLPADAHQPRPGRSRVASVTGSVAVRAVLLIEARLGEGPIGTCLRSQQEIGSHQLGRDPRWPRFGAAVHGLGTTSVLAVPVLGRGEAPSGVLAAFSAEEEAFDSDDVRVLSAFGRVLGATLEPGGPDPGLRRDVQHDETGVVHQAVGILMSRGCDEENALRRLSRISRSTSESMPAAARMIVIEAQRQAHLRYISQSPSERGKQYLLVGL